MDSEIIRKITADIFSENHFELYEDLRLRDSTLRFDLVVENLDSVIVVEVKTVDGEIIAEVRDAQGKVSRLKQYLEARDVAKDVYLVGIILGKPDGSLFKALEDLRHDVISSRNFFFYVQDEDEANQDTLKHHILFELMPVLPLRVDDVPGLASGPEILRQKLGDDAETRELLNNFLADRANGIHNWFVVKAHEGA